MTEPTFAAELIERCAKKALATHQNEVPSTALSWESHDGDTAAYASKIACAVLRESGHADLVAALKEAIAELALYSAAVTGESFNKPAWNDALRKAGADT